MRYTVVALGSLLLAACASVDAAPATKHGSGKRNVIFMISDGFGQTSETMARTFVRETKALDYGWASVMDSMLKGSVRTAASNTLVTDSAAGATAYSCGLKTYNGAIGVDQDGKPCGTIMEAAKAKGYKTALVTTSRITHATPASFAAHVAHRDMEDLIALQMIGRNLTQRGPVVDLMYGGGLCHFLPDSNENSCRSDNVDLWKMAQDAGFSTIDTRETFNKLVAEPARLKTPILGLFADDHMSYEIDRQPLLQPSLTEMTKSALDIISRQARQADDAPGFFIMIEGARIDMAGHDNDPATQIHDVVEYWNAVTAAKEFVARHPDTLLVSTSDHETGGLALGIDGEYLWYPEVLKPVKRSAESLCKELRKADGDVEKQIANTVLPKYLGIANATSEEVAEIAESISKGSTKCKMAIGNVVSRRAHVGWSTGGHTGTDVGLYACGNQAGGLHGNVDNTQLGHFLERYLGVDTRPITEEMKGVDTHQAAFSLQARSYHQHN
ncbi:vacuolar alkaline phosphatase [Coemansia biformis]|uniref:Alkaline phosphatase n=1 Tax=Coemansia biformis TaxID=1286918 RepID=A0A9W7YHP2_9FUNG|nr:vacuolar alkaline phosphatase [Coemansia biformis]